jgi:hypothetical protein
MNSSMVPLYMIINYFSTMVYAPTHGVSGILPGVSTPLLIQRKFNKLVVQGVFTKFLCIKYHKNLRAIDKLKFNRLEKLPKGLKIIGLMQQAAWAQL